MKIKITLILLAFTTFCSAQIVTFTDVNFKNKVLTASATNTIAKDASGTFFKIDANNDGEIQISEALQVRYLDVSNSSISDVTGIESFTFLNTLNVSNNTITTLTLNPTLQSVNASYNSIAEFQLGFHTAINSIDISNNALTGISIYSCNALSNLVYNNNPLLQFFTLSNTNISTLSIANFPNLSEISCNYNASSGGTKLTSLTTFNLPMLSQLSCVNNSLTTLDVSGAPNLIHLYCQNNNLSTLDVTEVPLLFQFNCSNNTITNLNTVVLTNLYELNCKSNQITSLNLSNLSNLYTVDCSYNQITSLLLNGATALYDLNCRINQLTTLNASVLPNLRILNCSYNAITSLSTTGSSNLEQIQCNNNQISTLNISDLTNLLELACNYNGLTSLNLNGLSNLNYLDFSINSIIAIDVSTNLNLQTLYCSNNNLTTIDLTGLNNLIYFKCNYNNMTTLAVSNLPNLGLIECKNNQLNSLYVSNLPVLNELNCSFNALETLWLNNLPNTLNLNCDNNMLTTLDLNNAAGLYSLSCNNNLLTSLLIKIQNGSFEYNFIDIHFSGNPNLQYICAFPIMNTGLQTKIATYGYTNCTIGNYCPNFPTGTYYLVQGTSTYDTNGNGCDTNDTVIPNMKFSVTNGATHANFISSTSGSYTFPVLAGTNVITPAFENPNYFTSNPPSVSVSFPATTSPSVQNFCITPNGNQNDLEVVVVPINNAVPGFDVNYKIIYKNNGMTVQNGTVQLTFDDAILDFTTANPLVSSQTLGSLSWNYSSLLPFESRTLLFTLNLNSPMETPAVNGDDVLNFAASVSGLTDDNPVDNSITLNQTVVNSFDPNDKTCLEGTTITPEMVGKYVHYLIRFENNGTANAQNIIVKDAIDTSKFDIDSLVPLDGSDLFETKITNENQVEFRFIGINLPFDDANNDGYVTFKIKTLPTLQLGTTFSNSASIYFDYNFPIDTNNYATTIENDLGTNEHNLVNEISVYPNPVKHTLNFKLKEKVNKVEVYDLSGRIVSALFVTENKVDVSDLKTGPYIVKIYTDKGIMNTKIIKE